VTVSTCVPIDHLDGTTLRKVRGKAHAKPQGERRRPRRL
jgi:hypothetical protein